MRSIRVALLMLVAAACATNPATGRRQLMLMSEAEEIQLGRQSDEEVRREMGVYGDAPLQAYVRGIGQRLAAASHRPNLPWTFTVVDASAVNAFALPGGFIYITRGILPFIRDEAELAAVLGHETGHVDARHSAAAYSRQTLIGGGLAIGGAVFPKIGAVQGAAEVALGLAFLRNSREAELEADQLGVGYTAVSGWAPEGMTGLLGTLGRLDAASGSSRGVPNWALTHPPAADRVARVQDAVAAARTSASTTRNRDAYERLLDGLVFGDSREQGIVRGNEFLHPILRLALRFPSGWAIANGADAVTAQPSSGSAGLIMQLVEATSNDPRQVAQSVAARSNLVEVSGASLNINGLTPTPYVATYDGQMNNQAVRIRAAFARLPAGGSQYVLLAGLAPTADFATVLPAFDGTIRSFRALSQAEADRVQPNRLDFHVVRAGETWASLASGPAGGTVGAAELAIMNGADPSSTPRTGARIRIIVGG